MKKPNFKIQSNYAAYEILLKESKVAEFSPILLSEKPQNRKILIGQVNLAHSSPETLTLFAEKNKSIATHYGIKVRASDISDHPIIRFDADGPTHRNDVDDVPLAHRQITTPHFHKFDQRGIEIAYKTQFLLNDANVAAIQTNIDLGMEHFSGEVNVHCKDNSFPTVEEKDRVLLMSTTDYDPLAGIVF